jgi:hypothetical protein
MGAPKDTATPEMLRVKSDPAVEVLGRTKMMEVIGQGHNHDKDETYIVQHGKDAFFPGEPGKVIAFCKHKHIDAEGIPQECWVLSYGTGHDVMSPQYVRMSLPYGRLERPPAFLLQPRLWLEMLSGAEVRRAYRVKGRT